MNPEVNLILRSSYFKKLTVSGDFSDSHIKRGIDMEKTFEKPVRNDLITKIFSTEALMKQYGEEIESLNREMEIVFTNGEKRESSYKEKYEEMKRLNPYGALFLRKFIDITEIKDGSDFSDLYNAYESLMDIGEKTENPDVYASAVKLLEGNSLEDDILWRDKYLDAVEKTCESFLNSDRSYFFLTDLLYEPREKAPEFEERFENVYDKIIETGREKNNFKTISVAYGLADHVEKVVEGSLEEDTGSIEIKGDLTTQFKKQRAYDEIMKQLSNNIICYNSQRHWIKKNIGLVIPSYEEFNDNPEDHGFGEIAIDKV